MEETVQYISDEEVVSKFKELFESFGVNGCYSREFLVLRKTYVCGE